MGCSAERLRPRRDDRPAANEDAARLKRGRPGGCLTSGTVRRWLRRAACARLGAVVHAFLDGDPVIHMRVTSLCMSDRGAKLSGMELQEIAALATSAGVVIALLAAVVSNVVAVRGQRLQERTSRDDATAYGVSVTGHDSLIGPDHLQGGPVLQPGEALTFMAARVLATSDSTITVRWRDIDDEAGAEKTWRYPLPDRPPR